MEREEHGEGFDIVRKSIVGAMKSPSTVSTFTTTSSCADSSDHWRAAKCTDATLSETGALKCYLDISRYHQPVRHVIKKPK